MTYRLEVRPDALADIEEASRWYESREPDLGSDFTHEVLQAIDTLSNSPLAYRMRHKRKNVRWKLLDRFSVPRHLPAYRRSHYGYRHTSQRAS